MFTIYEFWQTLSVQKKREKNDSERDFEIKCKLFEIRDNPDHFDLD